MAFMTHSISDGRVPPLEYLPVSTITPTIGMALIQTGGMLAIATGTNKPTYIAMCERESVCTAGELIPVMRVQSDIIFETSNSVAFTSVKLGNKVTLTADGTQVTATTTGGVAEVVYIEGTATGSVIRVRFSDGASASTT